MTSGRPIVDLRGHFESKLILGHPGGHWSLGVKTNNKGYRVMSVGGGETAYAHRVAYELYVGPIPPGLVVDHLCRVTWCCNPAHLEAVTQGENIRRAYRTCGSGEHDMADPANYYQRSNGGRMCKPCNLRRNRSRRARP